MSVALSHSGRLCWQGSRKASRCHYAMCLMCSLLSQGHAWACQQRRVSVAARGNLHQERFISVVAHAKQPTRQQESCSVPNTQAELSVRQHCCVHGCASAGLSSNNVIEAAPPLHPTVRNWLSLSCLAVHKLCRVGSS